MLDILRERAKLIALVVVAIAVVVGLTRMSGDPKSDPTGQTQVVATRHDAEDAAAKTVLQSASLAMETMFAQTQSFASGAAGAAAVEPNVNWTNGPGAAAASNQVAVLAADATSYTIATTSAGGTTFTYVRDAAGMTTKTCGPGCTW